MAASGAIVRQKFPARTLHPASSPNAADRRERATMPGATSSMAAPSRRTAEPPHRRAAAPPHRRTAGFVAVMALVVAGVIGLGVVGANSVHNTRNQVCSAQARDPLND